MKDITSVNSDKIVKDLERINKIKAELRKGNKYHYDESIKPKYRCRDDEYSNSN